jgi:hypothetical protein
MRIRRGPLFWGLLLIPLGAIPLLVRAGILDVPWFSDIGRFWPLILVGIGLAILLGRSRASLVVTAVVALVLGTLGGAALATGNLAVGDFGACVPGSTTLSTDSDGGAFDGPATVTIDLDCGSVDLSTTDGEGLGWTLDARYRNEPPIVSATGSSLDVRAPADRGAHRQEWTLAVPAGAVDQVNLTANAAAATLDLAGADVERIDADLNAGDLRVDAGEGRIGNLDVSMNAGRARVTLSASAQGSLSANAGAIELCVPSDATLRFEVEDQLTFGHNLDDRGLTRDGDTWTRDGSSETVIEFEIDGNAASFTLEPEGGC